MCLGTRGLNGKSPKSDTLLFQDAFLTIERTLTEQQSSLPDFVFFLAVYLRNQTMHSWSPCRDQTDSKSVASKIAAPTNLPF